MGNGCESSCNSARNRLPRNIEGFPKYFELTNETQNGSCSNKYSNHKSVLWTIARKSSNGGHSRLISAVGGNVDYALYLAGNCAFVGESMNDKQQTDFPNIDDYEDRMSSEHSGSSCEITTSGELPSVADDNFSVDCHDSETANRTLDRTREFDNKVNHTLHNSKDVSVEKNYNGLHTSVDLPIKTRVKFEGNLSVQKSSAEKQKKRHILVSRKNSRIDESELLVEEQEWYSNPNNNMGDSFGANMMGENNPSDKRHNTDMVSNPGICIYPAVLKQHKAAHTLGSSDVTFQSRASSFKTIHTDIANESCGRVTPDESNNTKRTSTNREPYSKNREVHQFQAIRNPNEIDERRDRNSSSLVSETALLCEMDRGLAVTPTVPDCNFDESISECGEQGCGEYEWPLVRVKNSYHVGDDSVDNAAIMINEGREFHETENADSEFTTYGEYADSYLQLEKQFFCAHKNERERSFFLNEMSQRLDNTRAGGVSEPSLSKVGMHGASESSHKSPTASSITKVLGKTNKPVRNPLVDVYLDRFDRELQPSNIFSVEKSRKDYSMMSTGEAMLYGKKYFTKNAAMDEIYEKEHQQPNNAEHYSVMLLQQPGRTIVPEQSSQSTAERNKEFQCSSKTRTDRISPLSSKIYETVKQQNKKRGSQKQSINYLDSASPAQDIERGVKDISSNPLIQEISKWTVEDVQQWMMKLDNDVKQYSELFKSWKIDGELLSVLTDLDFASLIPNKVDRCILMKALKKIRQPSQEISWKSAVGCVQRYQLNKLINIGKFSTTHLARDLENGNRICAVKLMSTEKIKNLRHPEVAAREVALKEWLAISPSMQHQNMIEYYEHCTNKIYRGTHYKYVVVREHHRLNLELLVTNSIALGENVSRLILHQIVSLLAFLREKQIGHFGLRPSNLLVTHDRWQIKLTDWSSFKQFTKQSTHSKKSLDINHRSIYTAPEIYNHGEYALIAESWSLGVILFGLITGTVLFSSRKDCDIVYKAMREDNFIDFSKSLDDKISWSLPNVTKSFIFNLVRYNPGDRLDIKNFVHSKFYRGIIPSDVEYKSAMEIAFHVFLKHMED